jgi:hypothetical protein
MSEMDDQRFDDGIKSKVGDYEDPGFDPAALASLHRQIAAASVVPWYSLYRTELMVGSGLMASTLVILWSQWFMSSSASEILNDKIIAIQNQQEQIDKLQNEISELKSAPPDTIRIIEIRERPSSDYSSLLYRVRLLEAEAVNRTTANSERYTDLKNVSENDKPDKSDSSSYTKWAWSAEAYPNTSVHRNSFSSRLSPRTTERESLHATPDSIMLIAQSNSKNLSAKTIRDIENHYQKGIGIRMGPTLELAKSFYDIGDGKVGIGGGILADFILSPSLSVETGLKYAHHVYDISAANELTSMQLPGMDETIGTLKKIDIDSWVFEIPVNLKYRYPVSIKTHWLGGLGYSSLLYGKQVFEYEYNMDGNPDVTINSDYEFSMFKVYPGALNFSLGLSNQLKNKAILETSIYYQVGLGDTGVEKNSINYLGARGVYWFTIK